MCADHILEMRDISVDESEELPQILHPLVNDSPPALAGRNAPPSQVSRLSAIGCFRDRLPAPENCSPPQLLRT